MGGGQKSNRIITEFAMCNRIWPTAVAGKADNVSSVSASACHIGGPKGVSPGQKALHHGNIHHLILTAAFFFIVTATCQCLFSKKCA